MEKKGRQDGAAQASSLPKVKKMDKMRTKHQDRVTLIVTDGKGIRIGVIPKKTKNKRYRADKKSQIANMHFEDHILSKLICRRMGLGDNASPSSLGPIPLSVPPTPASVSMSHCSSSFGSQLSSAPSPPSQPF